MALHAIAAKIGSTLVTGIVGAAAYDATRKFVTSNSMREGAVTVTTWGLRGTRKAEEVAERVRLETSDIVAEAKDRIGEESSPPGVSEAHDHEH